jgi:hypothetical protein
MAAVNKVLNVVFACEIRGRLRCSAASIRYRGRIRKGFVHTPVTRLSRNCCQARNYRCGPASGLQPSDADGSCRHVRGYEHSPWICAPHALFLPIRAADGRQRESSGGSCLIRRSARQVARFPVSRKGWRARKARSKAMKIRRCAISAQIAAISRTATPQSQSGAQSESRIEDKVMGTPRHVLHMPAARPFNRPAEWVDLSRRGWHERATHLMARVP